MYPETFPRHNASNSSFRDSISRSTPFPKLEFPKFAGENPRLWRGRCEIYFEVYSVSDQLKTRFVALNFVSSAAL
jgi:hypothetical protein